MSVIAVKVHEDRLEVAADSIVVKGYSKRTDQLSKLVEVNNMIIGGVGTAEDNSLMFRYAQTHRPASSTEQDVLAFIAEFSIWKKDYGSATISNAYIILYDGKAWCVEGMLVYEIKTFDAIGAGCDFAAAALFLQHDAVEAVRVACHLSCYVAEPIISFVMMKDGEVSARL